MTDAHGHDPAGKRPDDASDDSTEPAHNGGADAGQRPAADSPYGQQAGQDGQYGQQAGQYGQQGGQYGQQADQYGQQGGQYGQGGQQGWQQNQNGQGDAQGQYGQGGQQGQYGQGDQGQYGQGYPQGDQQGQYGQGYPQGDQQGQYGQGYPQGSQQGQYGQGYSQGQYGQGGQQGQYDQGYPQGGQPNGQQPYGQQPYGQQPYGQQPGGPVPPQYGGQQGYPQPLSPSDDKLWASLAHFLGVLWILPSLVIFLVFKDRGPRVRQESKEALNWQITFLISYIALSIVIGIIQVILYSTGVYGIAGLFGLLQGALYIVNLVFSIIGGVRVTQGGSYRYPVSLRLIK